MFPPGSVDLSQCGKVEQGLLSYRTLVPLESLPSHLRKGLLLWNHRGAPGSPAGDRLVDLA